jgi:hypothetical protein
MPIDRWIAKQHAQLSIAWKGRVHLTHGTKKLLVNREVPARMRGRRILRGFPQLRIWHVAAANESIHQRLIPRAAELHDNVVPASLRSL